MAHTKEQKASARNLYVNARQSATVIAVTIGVSPATIRRWKSDSKVSGDDWDLARAASSMIGEGFDSVVGEAVDHFVVMFQSTMSSIKDNKEMAAPDRVKLMASLTDSFSKMMTSAGKSSPSLSKLGIATDVLKLLADYIREKFPQHSSAFLEIIEPFAEKLAQDFRQ